MTEHSSDKTTPADHLIRTTEVEAVVQVLKAKVKDLQAPEPPDLTEVKAAVDRAYKIILYGADQGGQGYGWGVDPQAEKIFDDPNRQRSLFTMTFGVDGYGYSWSEFMQSTTASVMRLTFGNTTEIAGWLDNAGHSLATITVGDPTLLNQLSGKTLIAKIFDQQADITSLKSEVQALKQRVTALGG